MDAQLKEARESEATSAIVDSPAADDVAGAIIPPSAQQNNEREDLRGAVIITSRPLSGPQQIGMPFFEYVLTDEDEHDSGDSW